MASHFDPYHKWLGIPPKDQPPNHYRLLGVEKFESDREVIDAAANRIMAYLQEMATGEFGAESQRLLNQISTARLVLLNPEKKAAYDHELRASVPMARAIPAEAPQAAPAMAKPLPSQHDAPPPPPSATDPMEPVQGAGPLIVTDEPRTGTRSTAGRRGPAAKAKAKGKKEPSLLPVILLAITAIVIAVVAYLVLNSPSRANSQNQRDNAPGAATSATRLQIPIETDIRDSVVVSIDRQIKRIPGQGRVEFDVEPGLRRLRINREGYTEIVEEIAITKGEIVVYRPQWKADTRSTGSFDIPPERLQNLDQARPTEEADASGEGNDSQVEPRP